MAAPSRKPSQSDLTEEQWALLQPLLPPAQLGGRPRAGARREVINPILSLNRTGCPWDMRPHDLLPTSTAYESFSPWRDEGTGPPRMNAWREPGRLPPAPSRQPPPSAARLESQAVKTPERGGERGDAGGTKSTGRTRPMRVETLGLLVVRCVSRAAVDDAVAAPQVLQPLGADSSPRWAVGGAANKDHHHALYDWSAPASEGHGRLAGGRHPAESQGFVVLPKRWGVERTFAWLGRCRRTSQDDERHTDASESMLRVRALHLRLKRLKPSKVSPPFRSRVAA
jgi:putative transposase